MFIESAIKNINKEVIMKGIKSIGIAAAGVVAGTVVGYLFGKKEQSETKAFEEVETDDVQGDDTEEGTAEGIESEI